MFTNLRSFGLTALSVFVAATSVFAQTDTANPITNPTAGTVVQAGQTFTITWTPTTNGTVQLSLINGPAANVNYLLVIAAAAPNTGSYAWAVPATEPAGTDYAIAIKGPGSNDLNFSPRFTISSSVSTTASGSSTASAASTASSASASTSGTASAKSASASASRSASAASTRASSTATSAPPPTSGAESMKFGSVFMIVGAILAGIFAM